MKIGDFSQTWKDLAKGAMPKMTAPSQETPVSVSQDESSLSREGKAEYHGIFDVFKKKDKDGAGSKPAEQPSGIFDKPAASQPPQQPQAPSGPGAPTTLPMDDQSSTSLGQAQQQLSQSDLEKRLKERLKVIESLARGLGGDFRMSLREGDCWAYSFNDNTMIYNKDDLMNRHEDYCVGVVLHETGHHEYSEWNIEPQYQIEPFKFLMNAVEDPRVNNLMASRFKGAPQFFKRVYDEELFTPDFNTRIKEKLVEKIMKEAGVSRQDAEKVAEGMVGQAPPKHLQYGLGLIYDWYTNGKDDPRIKDKQVMDTLHKTAGDYRKCFGLKRDIFEKDLSPAEVHKQAQETYEAVRDKIWPEYKKLVEEDKKNLAKGLQGGGGGGQGQKSQQSSGGGQGKESQQNQQGGGSGSSGAQKQQQNQKGGGSSGSSGAQQPPGADKKQQSQGGGGAQDQKDQQGAGGPQEQKDQSQGGGGAQDAQKDQDKKSQGAGGGQDAKKPEENKGAGGGKKMSDEEAKRIADKIIDELSKDMSGMLEGKEQQAKKQGRKPSQGQQGQQNQKSQGADKGKENQGADQGKDSKDGKDAQGADKADGTQDSQGQDGQGGDGPGSTSEIDLPSLEELLKKKMELDAFVQPKNEYDRYYRDIADAHTDLTGQLKNVLKENESRKFIGYYPTGKRISMKKAMQSEAKMEITGDYDPEIWERATQPTKRGWKFQFVLDESGSMQDPGKWDNALRALVLGGESLNELKIDFGIVGFSDEPKIHKDFKDQLDDQYRDRIISDILDSPHGGTNDADAVKVALESIRKQPSEAQKFIFVITDGQGKEAEMKQLVKDALNEGIIVIGIGIDQAMEHVKEVYPIHVLVNNINALPNALGDLIKEIVEGRLDIGAILAEK
jgi:hypothetical protein